MSCCSFGIWCLHWQGWYFWFLLFFERPCGFYIWFAFGDKNRLRNTLRYPLGCACWNFRWPFTDSFGIVFALISEKLVDQRQLHVQFRSWAIIVLWIRPRLFVLQLISNWLRAIWWVLWFLLLLVGKRLLSVIHVTGWVFFWWWCT